MPQSTILAAAVTAATSTNVTLASGVSAILGIFSATPNAVPAGVAFTVLQVTPGADNVIASLGAGSRSSLVTGPGTYRVRRAAYTGAAFGVFADT